MSFQRCWKGREWRWEKRGQRRGDDDDDDDEEEEEEERGGAFSLLKAPTAALLNQSSFCHSPLTLFQVDLRAAQAAAQAVQGLARLAEGEAEPGEHW